MEKVLVYEKNCVEFNREIEELNSQVETEYGGSQTFKEVQILVIISIFLLATKGKSSRKSWLCEHVTLH